MNTATPRWAALLLCFLVGPAATAQSLGDEFIFFVNGTNVMVPNSQALVVNDPLAPASGNRVARFNAGTFTHAGFSWAPTTGVDASQSVGATYGESDTLYFRMLSDPANATQANVSIMLSDKTNGSGANDGTADNEFRLVWRIPTEYHDGAWRDIAIPLPPATRQALEDARTAGTLDANAALWDYTGAWSTGGFGIGPGFGGTTADPLWREFEWNALYKMGPFWDNPNGGGPIYLDDVYIGGPGTDLGAAGSAPSAMSGVSFAPQGQANLVSWGANAEFGGYNVYGSLSPITDVSAAGVLLLETVAFSEPLQLLHRYEVPHPSFGAAPVYYAVTSLSPFGVENTSVAASSGQIANPSLPQKAFIRQLTSAEADALFDDVSSGRATDDSFPADQPVFRLDESHRSPGDGTTVATLPTATDNSGLFKLGYTDLNELFIYGEITDDQVTLASVSESGTNTWNYDSAEIVFGHYDVRNVAGGGVLVGSPHQDMQRGAEPDYGIRIAALRDETGTVARSSTWVGWSIDTDFESATVYERTATGWKFLTLLPLDQIQDTTPAPGNEADVFMPVPSATALQMIPFIISINDADGGTRETQQVWSIKPNVTTQWWNTPAEWETVALAGRNVAVASEGGADEAGFSLAQSTPNPAAGQADIAFTLGAAGRATVEVFNTLGQRVAVVASGEFAAGRHSVTVDTGDLAAGVYVYRFSAGDYVATRRMTVVR